MSDREADNTDSAGAAKQRPNAQDKATKERDTAFLVEEFDVETHDAAELVAEDESEAEEFAQQDFERQREQDSLEGVPAPESPDDGPVERVQNHMHKEVLHDRKS